MLTCQDEQHTHAETGSTMLDLEASRMRAGGFIGHMRGGPLRLSAAQDIMTSASQSHGRRCRLGATRSQCDWNGGAGSSCATMDAGAGSGHVETRHAAGRTVHVNGQGPGFLGVAR